jgi:hypothetical protein
MRWHEGIGVRPNLFLQEIGTHMDGRFVNYKSAITNAFNSFSSSSNLISHFFDAMMHLKSLVLFGRFLDPRTRFPLTGPGNM